VTFGCKNLQNYKFNCSQFRRSWSYRWSSCIT